MEPGEPFELGKRERQLVEAVFRLGEASVAQVRAELADTPSYSAVRAMLNLLCNKRVLAYREVGRRYVYRPVSSRGAAQRWGLKNLVANFFAGNPADAVASLLGGVAGAIDPGERERLRKLIDELEQAGDPRPKRKPRP